MKREIFCPECALELGKIDPLKTLNALDAAMAAQEKVVKVYGKLRASALCNFCSSNLNPGDDACCQSVVPMGGHYYEWEPEYIIPR